MQNNAHWYEDWFDRDEYELVYQNRDEEEAQRCVELIERTANPDSGSRILDVGCGRGRHAVTLSRRGYEVTGLDLSKRAIQQARQRARQEDADVTFKQANMLERYCDECFDGMVNLFTAFGYFENDDDHFRAMRAMAANLHSGGWLFQDFMNPPYVRSTLVPEDEHVTDGYHIRQQRWIADGRINKEIILTPMDRDKHDVRTFRESVRLLNLNDFRALYAEAGLQLEATFGNYDGATYTKSSPRLILFTKKS